DEMQSWVEKRFSSIPNHHLQGKKVEVPIVGELSTGIQVHVEPIKEVRKLILTFPMPNMDAHYGIKPLSFFAHLLGYEGEGSLMMQLKEK
ncbi:insulinase family protein, partial [Vibrio sp. 10N.222.55.E8]